MSIEHILAEKGHTVITVEPERTLLETARLLAEKRIGAVVVGDADHPGSHSPCRARLPGRAPGGPSSRRPRPDAAAACRSRDRGCAARSCRRWPRTRGGPARTPAPRP